MSKTTYTATFSNGQSFTRKSHRGYTHAWSFPVDRSNYKGFCTPSFAGSYELARKAMERSMQGADNCGPGEIVEVTR